MDDLFRSMFGFGRRGRPESPHDGFPGPGPSDAERFFFGTMPPPFFQPPGDHNCQDDDEASNYDNSEDRGASRGSSGYHSWEPFGPGNEEGNFHFGVTITDPADMFRHFDEMFRSFDEVFRSMGVAEFPSQHFPALEQPPAGEGGSLRDRMLKQPDSHLETDTQRPTDDRRMDVTPGAGIQEPSQQRPRSFFGSLFGSPKSQHTPKKPAPELRQDSDVDISEKEAILEEIIRRSQTPSESVPSQSAPDESTSVHSEKPDVPNYRAEISISPSETPSDRSETYSNHRSDSLRPESGDSGSTMQLPVQPPPRSHFRSVHIHTFKSADGKTEEKRVLQNNQGVDESTVTRIMGDQKYSVTTRKNEDGENELHEELHNMNDEEKVDFDRRWQSPSKNWKDQRLVIPKQEQITKVNEPDDQTKSMFKNLFGMSFPGFPPWKG